MNDLVLAGSGPPLKSLDDYIRLGEILARSGYFADARDAGKAVVKILAGAELGFGPLASLTGIHIVEGKPCPGSHLLAAAIRRSGTYDYRIVEHTDQRCSIDFLRLTCGDWQKIGNETLTLKEATDKGWTVSSTGKVKLPWAKTPKNMLFARCLSNGFKFHCPDLIGGTVVYDADELDAPAEQTPAAAVVTQPASQPAQLPPPPERLSDEEVKALMQQFSKLPPVALQNAVSTFQGRYRIDQVADLPPAHFADAMRWLNDQIDNHARSTPPAFGPVITREQFDGLRPKLRAYGQVKSDKLLTEAIGFERWSHLPASWLPWAEWFVSQSDADVDGYLANVLGGKKLTELTDAARRKIFLVAEPQPTGAQ